MAVEENEPMELCYDFDERVICLKVPLNFIDVDEVKTLHIELSRLSKID